jgi:hypothetical protein
MYLLAILIPPPNLSKRVAEIALRPPSGYVWEEAETCAPLLWRAPWDYGKLARFVMRRRLRHWPIRLCQRIVFLSYPSSESAKSPRNIRGLWSHSPLRHPTAGLPRQARQLIGNGRPHLVLNAVRQFLNQLSLPDLKD